MAGNGNQKNPADFAGTDGAIEGQSPAENSKTRHPMLHKLQKSQTETNSCRQTSRGSPSSCNTYHSTTSCTSYSCVNWASSMFPSSLATLLPKHSWHKTSWQDQMNLVSFNIKKVVAGVKLQLHTSVWCTLTLPMFIVGLTPRRKRKQTSGIMLDRLTKSRGGRMEIRFEASLKRPRDATESSKLVSQALVAVMCHVRILPTWIQYRNDKDETQFNTFLDQGQSYVPHKSVFL